MTPWQVRLTMVVAFSGTACPGRPALSPVWAVMPLTWPKAVQVTSVFCASVSLSVKVVVVSEGELSY